MRRSLLPLGVLGLSFAALFGCENKSSTTAPPPTTTAATTATATGTSGSAAGSAGAASASTTLPPFKEEQLNSFAPIPPGVEKPVLDDVTKLGQMLYFETKLSIGSDVSCASCHDFAKAGADGQALSVGSKKAKTKRNTPTILNAGGSFAQGWDARTSTIDDFVLPHVTDATIMGMPDDKKVVATLEGIPAYAAAFKKAFPDEKPAISSETIGRALGTYAKKLFARSRWDKFLEGDKTAITDPEKQGFAMFVEAGCTSCHQGKYLGATQAQKLGIAKPWPAPLGTEPGRFEVTHQEVDKGMWKVSSLRNVSSTGPWLHDGSATTLAEAIRLMSRHQVGKELGDPQIKAIEAFLATLTGDPPKELTAKPK